MISLFIDTSMANVSISVVKDNKILSLIKENLPVLTILILVLIIFLKMIIKKKIS